MLLATSALSVCTETMDYSTGTEPKLCKHVITVIVIYFDPNNYYIDNSVCGRCDDIPQLCIYVSSIII